LGLQLQAYSCLRYYVYCKMIAIKMVFVRFFLGGGGQRTNFGATIAGPRGYVPEHIMRNVLSNNEMLREIHKIK